MSIIRPADATHRDDGYSYYKADFGEWVRWDVSAGKWEYVGQLNAACLTLLGSVQVVELEKFGTPIAPQMPLAVPPAPMPSAKVTHPSAAPIWPFADLPEPVGVGFAHYFIKYQFVGSRITCNPPPLDTDQDVLVLVRIGHLAVMEIKMLEAGFVKEGSLPAEADTHAGRDNVFHSYRKGDMNYIVTTDEAFYQRFSAATELARKYNLMEKSDRIQLFQAVLYGKWWV